MKLIPCESPYKWHARGKYGEKQALVIEAENTAAALNEAQKFFLELKLGNDSSIFMYAAARRFNKTHIMAHMVNGEVYIINHLLADNSQ